MNAIEEAQCRVARAQDERDRLHERVRNEYGALHEVHMRSMNGDFRARTLESSYNRAVRDLRLAKQDLELTRDELRPEPAEASAPIETEVELTATEDGIEISGLPPELQDLQGRSGTGTVTEILPNGDAVVEIELGPEASVYARELQRYKGLCDQIAALPPTYGNPSREEKIAKKARLQLRKRLKAMAPLKTCWFCAGFSINNYESPCRNGKLDSGAVPTDACHVWQIARGDGYLTDECTVAMQEMREEIAAREAAKAAEQAAEVPDRETVQKGDCAGCVHLDAEYDQTCLTCEPSGDESGNPTHYEPVPGMRPYWVGGPIDMVNGMPWHVAVAECPWGDHVILQPGRYTDDSEDDGRICVDLTEPHEVYGPTTPSGALLNISSRQQEPASGFMQHIAAKIKEGEAANAARKKSMSVVFSEEGVSIDGRAPLHPAVVSAAIDAVKARKGKQVDLEGNPVKLPDGIKEEKNVRRSRVYEHDKFVLRISEDDLAEMWSMDPIDARTLVAKKLRLAPKEQLFEGEWDKEVQYLTDELTKISRQVSRELAAAMRGEA